jgi:hypothetical protein
MTQDVCFLGQYFMVLEKNAYFAVVGWNEVGKINDIYLPIYLYIYPENAYQVKLTFLYFSFFFVGGRIAPALLRQASYGTIKIGIYQSLKRLFVERLEGQYT